MRFTFSVHRQGKEDWHGPFVEPDLLACKMTAARFARTLLTDYPLRVCLAVEGEDMEEFHVYPEAS